MEDLIRVVEDEVVNREEEKKNWLRHKENSCCEA